MLINHSSCQNNSGWENFCIFKCMESLFYSYKQRLINRKRMALNYSSCSKQRQIGMVISCINKDRTHWCSFIGLEQMGDCFRKDQKANWLQIQFFTKFFEICQIIFFNCCIFYPIFFDAKNGFVGLDI